MEPNFALGRIHVIPGVAGTVIELPSRVIAAIHSWSRTTGYEGSIAGQAYRGAAQEGLAGEPMAARINQLTTTPTEEMMAAARKEADENALMQRAPYVGFTSAVQRITNWGVVLPDLGPLPLGTLRPLKFVMPFVAISSNVREIERLYSAPRSDSGSGCSRRSIRSQWHARFRSSGRPDAGWDILLSDGGWSCR